MFKMDYFKQNGGAVIKHYEILEICLVVTYVVIMRATTSDAVRVATGAAVCLQCPHYIQLSSSKYNTLHIIHCIYILTKEIITSYIIMPMDIKHTMLLTYSMSAVHSFHRTTPGFINSTVCILF